ncbi:pyridoxal phosphate-dependent aminotransferase [Marinihelvus fidelis]|uniref:Aminotransferase n=1 Tax=Marinihelvus fidelis TaxID=2613842 RepID=A0A5N0TF44_9GAMM|nr:pyridoxal phosphate-dependent aminotransferase [Marinihelvus fidelis]KAA9133084.1 pyridoxal phosphate-dependent aminotransferase [Marinihelvus fidelis]
MSLRVSNRVAQIKPSATIAVAQRARELRAEGRDIISLGFGEPDFDTPAHIKAAGIAAIERGDTKYPPVDGTPELKQAIIDKFKRDNGLDFGVNEITVGNGAKQVLFNLMSAVLDDGDEVLIPAPYWVSYPDMVKIAGGQPVIISTDEETDFKITPRMLRASLNSKSRLLLLNGPSNPTGKVYSEEEYEALGQVIREHSRLVVACDDIYEHIYWADSPFRTLLNACPDLADRTVVINGVSKAYAMTGWRIGYAGGPETLMKGIKKVQSQSTSGACSISQAAAAAALNGPQDCVEEMRQAFKERYEYLVPALNAIDGVECPGCDGAFYAFPSFQGVIDRMDNIANDVELSEWFLENAGVAMVPGTAFGAPGHIRLSFATSMEQLHECVRRITEALAAA